MNRRFLLCILNICLFANAYSQSNYREYSFDKYSTTRVLVKNKIFSGPEYVSHTTDTTNFKGSFLKIKLTERELAIQGVDTVLVKNIEISTVAGGEFICAELEGDATVTIFQTIMFIQYPIRNKKYRTLIFNLVLKQAGYSN